VPRVASVACRGPPPRGRRCGLAVPATAAAVPHARERAGPRRRLRATRLGAGGPPGRGLADPPRAILVGGAGPPSFASGWELGPVALELDGRGQWQVRPRRRATACSARAGGRQRPPARCRHRPPHGHRRRGGGGPAMAPRLQNAAPRAAAVRSGSPSSGPLGAPFAEPRPCRLHRLPGGCGRDGRRARCVRSRLNLHVVGGW